MEDFSFINNKEHKPYAGVWVYPLILILTPVVMYFFFRYVIGIADTGHRWRAHDEALLISAIVGSAVCLATLFTGAYSKPFSIVTDRIKEFFIDIFTGIPLSASADWYWESVKTEGAAFWIMLLPILLNAAYLIYALGAYYQVIPPAFKPNLPGKAP